MNGHSQVISMPKYTKRILLILSLIPILLVFIFLGLDYSRNQLASLSSIIVARVTINPLEVNVSAPAEAETGKAFKVEARIINKGEKAIRNAKAEIFLSEGLSLKRPPAQNLGVIRGKKEKIVSWQIRGEITGNYFITVKAAGRLGVGEINSEDSIMVKIITGTSPRQNNFFEFFQRFFDFIQ